MKAKLRKDVLEKRRMLSKEKVDKKSSLIMKKLFLLDEFIDAGTIMSYIDFDKEVKTKGIIEYAKNMDKMVVIPFIENNSIKLSVFNDFNELEKKSKGVLEPKKRFIRPFNSKIGKIDLMIIPGICFDKKGNRVGYGKGALYDRFLSNKNIKDSLKIALAYDFQVVQEVPAEKHDVPMDMIITEKRIIRNNS